MKYFNNLCIFFTFIIILTIIKTINQRKIDVFDPCFVKDECYSDGGGGNLYINRRT